MPKRLLDDFKGYLQTDGYDGYNAIVAANNLTHVGCMAHARRRFSDAVKAQGKKKQRGKAHRGLAIDNNGAENATRPFVVGRKNSSVLRSRV